MSDKSLQAIDTQPLKLLLDTKFNDEFSNG